MMVMDGPLFSESGSGVMSSSLFVVQLQIGIFYKRWFWLPSDVFIGVFGI